MKPWVLEIAVNRELFKGVRARRLLNETSVLEKLKADIAVDVPLDIGFVGVGIVLSDESGGIDIRVMYSEGKLEAASIRVSLGDYSHLFPLDFTSEVPSIVQPEIIASMVRAYAKVVSPYSKISQ